MIKSITLLGSSSGRNAGDAALVAGIMDAIDHTLGRRVTYEIPTTRPHYIRDNYRNDTKSISMMPWSLAVRMLGVPTYRSIMRTDLSLIFDAILFDRSLYNPLFNFMSSLYLMLPHAKKHGKKMGMYNVGVGPINTGPGAKMLKEIADLMDFITVRDNESLNILKDIGVTNPRMLLTADAALTVTPPEEARVNSIYRSLGLDPSAETMGINLSVYLDTWVQPKRPSMGKERFLATYAAALNRFVEETKAPILFVSTQHHDVPLTRELMGMMKGDVKMGLLSNVDYNHYDIKGALGKLALLFGMRLHATILSSAMLTPTIGLGHQPKVSYYFGALGMRELNMSFDDFSEEGLYQHMMNAWRSRREIRSKLEARIPELKRDAYMAADLVQAISEGEDLDRVIATLASEGRGALKQAS